MFVHMKHSLLRPVLLTLKKMINQKRSLQLSSELWHKAKKNLRPDMESVYLDNLNRLLLRYHNFVDLYYSSIEVSTSG
jgi:hypothetical protein